MTPEECVEKHKAAFAYNEALDDVLEVLDKQDKVARAELEWAKRSVHGSQEDRDIARGVISVIGELKSEIEKMKRT